MSRIQKIRTIMGRLINPINIEDIPSPPKEMHALIGDETGLSYDMIGKQFLEYFVRLGDLKPDETVLDIGCGCGRIAKPLSKYLSKKGKYEGIDVVPSMIEWCQKNIAARHPNFHFSIADVYNKKYNPTGKKIQDYRFPYGGGTFDFIFLTSVFTHMYPKDMEHYFSEIKRILKPGGRLFSTYFLIIPDFDFARSKIQLLKCDGYYTGFPEVPEEFIAYDISHIRDIYRQYDINIIEPIYYGFWSGMNKNLSKMSETLEDPHCHGRYQDIIIARKL